jgi:peptide/nickel transport system substrate-binding protein
MWSYRPQLPFGDHPVALAAAGGGLWTAVDAAGADHRGGTLTSISYYTNIDWIDPAASNSPNVPPPQLLGLTNDGLVTLNHVAGPLGTRLVPDLALALPVPTSTARTYTFHLRPGIRYSTGAFVKPTDVTHSFERLFELGSSGTAYYQAIVGATACQAAPKHCDLSRGIVADNRTGTVIFHLTRPDPDFLYKLTFAYADVLPGTAPGQLAQTPLLATGPYMITRYRPGQEVLLVRNPHFREWSAAAQPDGYPDRIVIRLGLTAAQGATAVADSRADFMPNLGRIPGSAAYFLRHRSQLRINPLMGTAFMFLNVHAAPFNSYGYAGPSTSRSTGSKSSTPTAVPWPPSRPARSCPRNCLDTAATVPTPATHVPTAAGAGQTSPAPGSSSPPPAPGG